MAKARRTIEVAPLEDDALALVRYRRWAPFNAHLDRLSHREMRLCTVSLAMALAHAREELAKQGITLNLRCVSPEMRRTMRRVDQQLAERAAGAAGGK